MTFVARFFEGLRHTLEQWKAEAHAEEMHTTLHYLARMPRAAKDMSDAEARELYEGIIKEDVIPLLNKIRK